jgi:hypothetical protein
MPLSRRQLEGGEAAAGLKPGLAEEEYYQRKSEKSILNREDAEALDTKLKRRLFDWKQESSGEVGLYKDEHIKIEARCHPCDFSDPAIKNYKSLIGFDINTNRADWRRLADLTISVEGETRSLSDILPGWQIIFNVGKEYRAQSGSDYDSRTIYLDDISVLKNIVIMCHEVGHAANSEGYADDERKSIARSVDACDFARRREAPIAKEHLNRVLKNERNAWATAAKITSLLVKGRLLSKADVCDIVHRRSDGGLGSYSLGIKGFVRRGLILNHDE